MLYVRFELSSLLGPFSGVKLRHQSDGDVERVLEGIGPRYMDLRESQHRLRLVGSDDPIAVRSWRAKRAVAQENRAAGGNPSLDPTDPRWVLAARAYSQLQGTTLTPERRQRVLRNARQLGVRPFEANVIIAVVQDHARRSAPLAQAADTLSLLRDPRCDTQRRTAWSRWIAAGLTALAANAIVIWWLISA